MGENIGKILTKILSGKHSQKLLDQAAQSIPNAFKTTSKKQFKKQKGQLVI